MDRIVILLDNNQLVIANLFQSLKYDPNINEDMVRHLMLNTYRMYRSKFHDKYGEIVWRHQGYIVGEELEVKKQIQLLINTIKEKKVEG